MAGTIPGVLFNLDLVNAYPRMSWDAVMEGLEREEGFEEIRK